MENYDEVQCIGCGDTLVLRVDDVIITMEIELREDDTVDLLDAFKFRCQACASAAGVNR